MITEEKEKADWEAQESKFERGIVMRVYKVKLKPQKVVSVVVCNQCGKTVHYDNKDLFPEYMHQIHTHPGYGSSLDNAKIQLDICESCFLDFLLALKVVPEGLDQYQISLLDRHAREEEEEGEVE